MDSVTQIALGAAIGEAVLGRKAGARAIFWGAVCGTLPDLDVFIPLGDAVRDFTYHRSATHSLFVLAVLSPLIVWLILKIHPQTSRWRYRWLALVYLVFATHVLLDSFTVYGTQIFWPIDNTPVAWSTIFIIDPAYTLPLLAGALCALLLTREHTLGHRLNWAGLVLSSAYLAWTVAAKQHVEQIARESLSSQGIENERLLTVPAPLNSILWRVLVMGPNGYHEGFYSLLDNSREISLLTYPSQPQLLTGIEDHWPVQRLEWFTRGFYSVNRMDNDVIITDLRMGIEGSYVFRFKVGELQSNCASPVAPVKLLQMRAYGRLINIWKRIWDENVSLPEPGRRRRAAAPAAIRSAGRRRDRSRPSRPSCPG